MRWLQKSSQAPAQLIGLSPLKTEDTLSISTQSINLIEHKQDINYETNQSTRKSRKDFSSFRTLTWSKKFAKSTENCYSIQEGRVIDRSGIGQCNSPVRPKRSSSPSNQSISSIKTISTSTPTYFTQLRRLHRHKLANVLDFDKEVWRNNHNTSNNNCSDNDDHHKSISSILDEDECHKEFYNKTELNRTFCGAYSVPYREKRNPLNHTRLSCYKPIISEQQFEIQSLKNFKSVDDFLSMDMNNTQSSTDHDDHRQNDDETKINEKGEIYLNPKHKRKGLSSKFRTMSDKTQKLFSKLYSNSNLKSSSAESSSDITTEPISRKYFHSRRSLSYGTLTQVKEFDSKKVETEDGDSGILINESGASSMTDENSEPNKKVDQDELFKLPPERKYVQRIEIKYDHKNTAEEQNEPKICSSSFNKHHHHIASCTDLSLTSTSIVEKRQKNRSIDSGLNDAANDSTAKRNSVSEIVALLEKNDNNTKFNTLNHPRRSKGTTLVINQEEDTFDASTTLNMCDDDKLKLKTAQSKEKIDDNGSDKHSTPNVKKIPSTNFCTLPRKAKTSPHCTFHTVIFEKGPGKKALGFTIVGGADSPRGALGIFIKSIMAKGQAVESGQLKAGDEILAVNGHVCHDLTHQDAIKLFKSVKSGEIVLNICRRKGSITIT
ncbi:uncharacterized protein [Chironomus tepperi]|uniref:uncharacterized protein n=1 Tax=Chironomus tepperi TaxID=113505 RepID=UPI00391F0FBA